MLSKAQIAGTIVRPIEQVFHLLDVCFRTLQPGLDDPTTPCARAGVPGGPGDALELRELLGARRQEQVERVQSHHFGPFETALAVRERSFMGARADASRQSRHDRFPPPTLLARAETPVSGMRRRTYRGGLRQGALGAGAAVRQEIEPFN